MTESVRVDHPDLGSARRMHGVREGMKGVTLHVNRDGSAASPATCGWKRSPRLRAVTVGRERKPPGSSFDRLRNSGTMSFVIYVLGLGIFAQGTSQLMFSGVPRRSDRLPARLHRRPCRCRARPELRVPAVLDRVPLRKQAARASTGVRPPHEVAPPSGSGPRRIAPPARASRRRHPPWRWNRCP